MPPVAFPTTFYYDGINFGIMSLNVSKCFPVSFALPDVWNIHIQCILAGEIIPVNIVILCIFLREQYISPVTVLLSALAITDSLTVLCATLPNFIAYYFYYHDLDHTDDINLIWNRKYPDCVVFNVVDDCAYAFHIMSVLLTTLLCVQKAVVMNFPIWAKRHVNTQSSFRGILIVILVSIPIFVPYTYSGLSEIFQGNSGGCCYSENHIFVTNMIDSYHIWRNESRKLVGNTTMSTTSSMIVIGAI